MTDDTYSNEYLWFVYYMKHVEIASPVQECVYRVFNVFGLFGFEMCLSTFDSDFRMCVKD